MNPKKLLRKVAPKRAVRVAEETYRKGRLGGAHVLSGLPTRKMRVIAVTGTNGKTSTCCFINDALRHAGYTTALYTTAVVEMAGERAINTNHTTVPKTRELFRFLKKARVSKVDFVILEVTSHALHQHKLWGIPIEIAVMTNISQDHLDYHGTMERYAEAKSRLFGAYMKPTYCVLNSDDEWYDYFLGKSSGQVVTYGTREDAMMRIESVVQAQGGITIRLRTADHAVLAHAQLIGEFNAYNLTATATVLEILGLKPNAIREAISATQSVPGRMEMIEGPKGSMCVVDYAHAPDALEKALVALRQITTGKVRVVFGATGDRDTTKRPIMGAVAAKNADVIYLTDDETYTEDGAKIRAEVYAGIVGAGAKNKCVEIADRYVAIRRAMEEARRGDMILIAGLGHQNYRAMNEGNIAWQEADVVREIAGEMAR